MRSSAARSTPASSVIRGALALAVVSVVLLVVSAAQAQTAKVLYNFKGGSSDGANPESSLTPDGAGNFFGTTYYGGLGYGTVFELSPNGKRGWKEAVLYRFCSAQNCTDGSRPNYSDVIIDGAGNLYGTTFEGGANGAGVVFKLSPAGKSWTETVLYSFCSAQDCGDGRYPTNGLIADAAGNLYGAGDNGTFELSPSGGDWMEQVIYRYSSLSNGAAGLTMDADGNIFGIIYTDTPSEQAAKIFELTPDGEGGWTPTVLHKFSGAPVNGTLALDGAGNLYGTTGSSNKHDGIVFKLSPGQNGKWMKNTLHLFQGGADGDDPWAGVVLDAAGNIYGTTLYGGQYGYGIVFELVPGRHGRYLEKILWNFNLTDGAASVADLVLDSAGNLYGTTTGGGSNGWGVVFEVTP
jgi:uncharacterized repeat protein (TIGR03803 family)